MLGVPVEPPPSRWALPDRRHLGGRGRDRGRGRRPGSGNAPGGLPAGTLPDAPAGARSHRPRADRVVVAGSPGDHPARRVARQPLAAAVGAALRGARRHRVRAGDARVRRPASTARLDRQEVHRRVHRAPPTRVGAQCGDVAGECARRDGARRWSVRREHRRPVRGRVEVPPRHRCVQGRRGRARRPHARRVAAPWSTCSGPPRTWPRSARSTCHVGATPSSSPTRWRDRPCRRSPTRQGDRVRG